MSIETDLGRIATALEGLLAIQTAMGSTPAAPVADKAPSTGSTRQRKNVERADPPAAEEPAIEEEPAAPEIDPLDDDLPPADPEYTADQVRAALMNYREIEGQDAMLKVLADHDAKGMGSLKPEHYASVMKAVK